MQIYSEGECGKSVEAFASYDVDTHQYDSIILNTQTINGDAAIADDMFIALLAGQWLVSYGPLSSDDPTYEIQPLSCLNETCTLYTDTLSGAVYLGLDIYDGGDFRKIESVRPLKYVGTGKAFDIDYNELNASDLASILQKSKEGKGWRLAKQDGYYVLLKKGSDKKHRLFPGFEKARQNFAKQFFASKPQTTYDLDDLKENSRFVVKEQYDKKVKPKRLAVYWRQKNNKLILLGKDWCCSDCDCKDCEDEGLVFCIGTFKVSSDGEKLFYYLRHDYSGGAYHHTVNSYYIVDAQYRVKYLLGSHPPGPDIR